MLAVLAVTISLFLIQIDLANSQSDCSATSAIANCVSPLTSNFTADCKAGRLSNYAECLSNANCLSPNTADIQLNPQYCRGGGCNISCVVGNPLACTLMCRPTENGNISKRLALFSCSKCFNFKSLFATCACPNPLCGYKACKAGVKGGASSTTAIIGVIIGTTVLAISTFM